MRRVITVLILWIVLGLVFWGTFIFFNRPDAPRLSTTWVALAFPMGLPLVVMVRRLFRRFLPRGHERLAWLRNAVGLMLIATFSAPLFLTGVAFSADYRRGLTGYMLVPAV